MRKTRIRLVAIVVSLVLAFGAQTALAQDPATETPPAGSTRAA